MLGVGGWDGLESGFLGVWGLGVGWGLKFEVWGLGFGAGSLWSGV